MSRGSLALVAALALAPAVHAAQFIMRDGSLFEARLLDEDDATYRIQLDNGQPQYLEKEDVLSMIGDTLGPLPTDAAIRVIDMTEIPPPPPKPKPIKRKPAPPPPPPTAADHYSQALRSYSRGDLQATIKSLKECLTLESRHAEAHYLSVLAYYQQGDLPLALASAEAAAKLSPEKIKPLIAKIRAEAWARKKATWAIGLLAVIILALTAILIKFESLRRSLTAKLHALDLNNLSLKQSVAAMDEKINLARFEALKNPIKAIESIGKYYDDYKSQKRSREAAVANAKCQEGHKSIEDGKPQDAIKAYCEALEIKPELVDARLGLGFLYLSREEYDKALEQYHYATRLAPDSPQAHYGLARTYADQKLVPFAIVELDKSLKLKQDFAEARELLEELLAVYSTELTA